MAGIEIIIPRNGLRRWQALVIDRLRGSGHEVAVRHGDDRSPWHWGFDFAFALERRFAVRRSCGLMQAVSAPQATMHSAPAVRIDLTGCAAPNATPTLTLAFDAQPTARGALDALVHGALPTIEARLDDAVVRRAAPMIDNRASIAAGLEDVLARAITLIVASAEQVLAGRRLEPIGGSSTSPAPRASFARYVTVLASLIGRESRRRALFRFAHWHTGYRVTGGTAWHELPDDGSHFFADPFPFVHNGHRYVFVEDFDHTTGKGVISVSEIDAHGFASAPRPVVEELTHLSYPQVLAQDGQIWMIPESSAAREVVLYRAERFPDRWVRHAVLVADAEISDATLLVRDGLYWLFGTLRDGQGSTSDTLVVYHAPALTGPWTAHAANPVRIDRAAARPAGAFLERDGRTYLPVQDGTRGYGSGIGLTELLELSVTSVRLGPRQRLWSDGQEPWPTVHTFNRHADLEVIDWKIAEPRRRGSHASSFKRSSARSEPTDTSLATSPAE